MVFVVRCGDETRCAKVYKEADKRSFRQAVDYTENRKTKNSRQARAMAKGTRFGREAQEKAWQSAEVDALLPPRRRRRARAPPLQLPRRRAADGARHRRRGQRRPAPERRGASRPEVALDLHDRLIREVVRMLGAGVVHGDLSEFNILLGADGPVIIDLPQAVDAAGNNHAPRMLVRDVDNLRRFFGRFAPELLATDYGKEIWALYEAGRAHARTSRSPGVRARRDGRRPRERDARDRRRAARGAAAAYADAGTRLADFRRRRPVSPAPAPRRARKHDVRQVPAAIGGAKLELAFRRRNAAAGRHSVCRELRRHQQGEKMKSIVLVAVAAAGSVVAARRMPQARRISRRNRAA